MRIKLFVLSAIILLLGSCSSKKSVVGSRHKTTLGTYASPPRLENSRVDVNKLIEELQDLNANTYNWLVWQHTTDWDDLQLFLPEARKKKINVWVTLVPPSESQPKAKWNSEPYKMDYERWAAEIAKLSRQHTNLIAWSIDDFAHNLTTYTPDYLQKMLANAKAVNPKLLFIPCVYYRQINKSLAEKYGAMFDGILFPYRAESKGANLTDATVVQDEIANIRTLFRSGFPVYLDVYQTAHSRLGASTPQYVKDVIVEGLKYADGVLIYTHPHPVKESEKYLYIKEQFSRK